VLTLDRLLQTLRQPDDEQALMEGRLRSVAAVDALMQRMELGLREHLGGMSLRDLVVTREDAELRS
jgi:hypothetical protein